MLMICRQLNHGSPINVVAGQGYADMSELVRFYEEQKQMKNEERRQALEAGKTGAKVWRME
jgi:hypothetical protein